MVVDVATTVMRICGLEAYVAVVLWLLLLS